MHIAIISFTAAGRRLSARVETALGDHFIENVFFGDLPLPLREWTRSAMERCDALIFIGAAGIAVRSIAPFVRSKATDPAVLVMDEGGHWVIPILSGHLGGGNRLAARLASAIDAAAVVTTATDVHGAFAVDSFAAANHLTVQNLMAAKRISAAILRGEKVGLFSKFRLEGDCPPELTIDEPQQQNIVILDGASSKLSDQGALTDGEEDTLILVRQRAVLGLGCRKGAGKEAVDAAVNRALNMAGVDRRELAALTSIDLKAGEPAIRVLSEQWKLPYRTYSAQELSALPGEFTASDFVCRTTGVDNVCERSALREAMRCGREAHILLPKQASGGVTAAVAEFVPGVIHFQGMENE